MKNIALQFVLVTTTVLINGFLCQPVDKPSSSSDIQLLNIVEDVIVDDSTTQKIIRVNPVELPAINPQDTGTESDLYNIQQIIPKVPHKKYTSSNSIRNKNKASNKNELFPDDKEIYLMKKPTSKNKHNHLKRLKFSYDVHTIDGTNIPISRLTRVHIAPGAYPVFYGLAKVNGQFIKNSIKSFNNEEQLIKNLIKIDLAQQKLGEKEKYRGQLK